MKGLDCVGETYKSKNSGYFVVTDYQGYYKVHVKFVETGYETVVSSYRLKDGAIKDRLLPSIYNVGIVGDEKLSKNGIKLKEYKVWRAMLQRCYNEKTIVINPTYIDCEVSDGFKIFPNFKHWCQKQIGFNDCGFQLDKDLLYKGNKLYSEENCVFIPQEINLLFVQSKATRGECPVGVSYNKSNGLFRSSMTKYGKFFQVGYFKTPEEAFSAYKIAKEEHIKVLANKWKDKIDPRAYETLMNYQVDITD